MNLSNFTQSRDNNFNLIRILAAFAVLVTHSFALAIGSGDAEPFRESLGFTVGSIAVDIFFITSGFLVTASLLARQSALEFVLARILRIFPALVVMLILTVFGLGVFFTSLPLSIYLTDSATYVYLLKCSTLISGVAYNLPGVFENNPYKNAVNGSLWTLTYELRMYALLVLVWVALGIGKRVRLKIFELAISAGTLVAGVTIVILHFHLSTRNEFASLFFMFFSGASFYVLRKYIALIPSLFWFFVVALIASAIANKHAFFIVYNLVIAYVLFYVADVPSRKIRKYNRVGDYSYGVYLYAFPVQQSIAALVPGVSVLSMLAISASATLLLAALSWHFLERRALDLKRLYVGHTRRILTDLTEFFPNKRTP